MANTQELTLDLDDHGSTKILDGGWAIARQIFNLFMMRKGSDPLYPDKGMDMVSWRTQIADDAAISKLKSQCEEQIMTYTMYYSTSLEILVDTRPNLTTLVVGLTIENYDNLTILITSNSDGKTDLDVQMATALS